MAEKEEELNIPDIRDIDDLIDDEEDEEEDDECYDDEEDEKHIKMSRQVEITTPYVSVTITTECKEDDMNGLVDIAKNLMDEYRYHHIDKDR